MNIHCPKCGAAARDIDSKTYSQHRHELLFKCASTTCQASFSGVLVLNQSSGDSAMNFSTQSADPIEETDC